MYTITSVIINARVLGVVEREEKDDPLLRRRGETEGTGIDRTGLKRGSGRVVATTAGFMIFARLRKRPRDIRESAFSLAASSRSICLRVRKIVENPPAGGGDE